MRWSQAILGSMLAWIALITHHGLFAPAIVIAGQVFVGSIWLFGRRRLLVGLLRFKTAGRHISWKTEIWPFQWRIAISWISGYFVLSEHSNPFLFAFKGPVAAGQMGMSLSFANSLMVIAMAWVSTKAAPFGALIARFRELDTTFFRSLRQSIGVAALGAVVIWSVTTYFHYTHSRYEHKLLSPLPFRTFACCGHSESTRSPH